MTSRPKKKAKVAATRSVKNPKPLDEKARALAAFRQRVKDNKGKQIDNGSLYAGSPMYFYCRHCGAETDVKPESYTDRPKTICTECKHMVDKGWMP